MSISEFQQNRDEPFFFRLLLVTSLTLYLVSALHPLFVFNDNRSTFLIHRGKTRKHVVRDDSSCDTSQPTRYVHKTSFGLPFARCMNRKTKLSPHSIHIYQQTRAQPTSDNQQNMANSSFSERFSKFCQKLKPRKQSAKQGARKINISYPQHVRSSAPISNRPTSAEERPLSRSSFTCAGLTSEFWQPELEPGCQRRYYVPTSSRPREWIPQPGVSLRTDELCNVCDKQPVRDGTGICKKCKFRLIAIGLFNSSIYRLC